MLASPFHGDVARRLTGYRLNLFQLDRWASDDPPYPGKWLRIGIRFYCLFRQLKIKAKKIQKNYEIISEPMESLCACKCGCLIQKGVSFQEQKGLLFVPGICVQIKKNISSSIIQSAFMILSKLYYPEKFVSIIAVMFQNRPDGNTWIWRVDNGGDLPW
jgi:hypothetical protein